MGRTFCIACDLQTKQFVWVGYNLGQMMFSNGEPMVASAAEISSAFARRYGSEL